MPESPDYTAAGEIYRKSMEEAMAHLDKVNADLLIATEQAIDREIAAREELERIQRNAEKLSQEFIDAHRKEYNDDLRKKVLTELTTKLILAGRSSTELKKWLDIEPSMITAVWLDLRFEPLGDRAATVTYDVIGVVGYIHFYWDGMMMRLPFRLTSGETYAHVDIPSADQWEQGTGLRLEDRPVVLEFIAKRLLNDLKPDRAYEIAGDYIRILA